MRTDIRHELTYWGTQLAGWSAYGGSILVWSSMNRSEEPGRVKAVLIIMAIGIGVSHMFRSIILRQNWIGSGILLLLARTLGASVLLGTFAFILQASLTDVLFPSHSSILAAGGLEIVKLILNWSLLLMLWSMGYIGYHYFIRSRREEVRNLRLETANRENQLSNLRAQLNPHFMFNALNGIRALIDEDPALAKNAITQLSAILRNAMSTVRRKVVPLGEELDIVKAYLALETMRYEERLRVRFETDPALERELVPPMLLQTLVENAVRHGIARLPEGGELVIGAERKEGGMRLSITNAGTYQPGRSDGNGIGLRNTRKRLEMIYGRQASLSITSSNGTVRTVVEIPFTQEHESIDH